MAGVKYIKKTPAPAPATAAPAKKAETKATKATAPTRKSTRVVAASKSPEPEAPTKPAANTKAKVTKKAPAKAAAAKAGAMTGRKPGRPKKEDAAKTNGVAKKLGRPKKETTEPPKETKARTKRKASEEVSAPAPKKVKTITRGPVINHAPTERLNVYVFGEGSSGELGLGTAKNAIDVKRPRLNANLAADSVGVVQIATGGMHVLALTHDNKILSWGVNDQGALGRDTKWEGGLKDMDDNKSDDSSDKGDDSGLNPKESTPTAIPSDAFPTGTVFTQLAAGDSTSFALTDDGHVYGWGTFRSNEGIFGFAKGSLVQYTPLLISDLKKITSIACGANHALALDSAGAVFAWGSGQQNQLGRRVVERTKIEGLTPREFGLPRKAVTYIECGQYHSFAIDKKDRVWSWGLNNYGETGIPDRAGEEEAIIFKPEEVKTLSGRGMTAISGGAHHSIGVAGNGDCLVWGRIDGAQAGVPLDTLPEDQVIFDERKKPRILTVPTKVTAIKGEVAFACAASDHNIAVTKQGQAWSWGFSANYQTGLGTDEDVPIATLIDNTAVRGKKLNWAGAGGQFGILTAVAGAQTDGEVAKTNGA
ncbi:hypothetical protein LTR50_001958 [Elasticomyces elasticus]|nr:hypothetical protein LTR50_001958 [Elasticomyces elasticus]